MKLPYRPILNLPKTKIERMADSMGLGIFLASILYVFIKWRQLPDKVPGHFNGLGEVDRWGSKYELFILPGIGLFLFSLMSLLEKAPHMHNYPSRLNELNVKEFYLHSRKLINMIKNICLLMFAYLLIQMTRVALGDIQSLGLWFLPIIFLVLFGVIIVGVYQQSKIK